MARELRTYPDPVLQEKGREIDEITDEIKTLAQVMVETMYANQGIGLAAPQVGESLRLIIVDVSGPELRQNLHIMVNPRICGHSGEIVTEEGCLSLPAFKSKVKRAEAVTVQGLDLQGNEQCVEAEGLLAVCFQHEIDHLNGKVLLDHTGQLKKNMYIKKAKKWKTN